MAWSPLNAYPFLFAAIDTSSAEQKIQIFNLFSHEFCEIIGSYSLGNEEVTSLAWTSLISSQLQNEMGFLIVGTIKGKIYVLNPKTILENGENPLITQASMVDNSAVKNIEIHPSKHNLVAISGSEVFIFNLDNLNQGEAMLKPGKNNPHEGFNVTAVAWNKSVQYILASASDNSLTVVWDLKQHKSIYNFIEPVSVIDSFAQMTREQPISRHISLAWNPSVATQIAVAACDEKSANINIWDLRTPQTPYLVLSCTSSTSLQSISWSSHDATFICSIAQEGKYYIWNSKNGDCLYESPALSGKCCWSDQIPGIFAIYSNKETRIYNFYDIPGKIPSHSMERSAPKWIKRKGICSFGFGGKLVTLSKKNDKVLDLFRVKANQELVDKAKEFEKIQTEMNIVQICQNKILNQNLSQNEQQQWKLIKALIGKNKNEIMEFLGYDPKNIKSECERYTGKKSQTSKMDNNPFNKNETPLEAISLVEAENFFDRIGRESNQSQKGRKSSTGEIVNPSVNLSTEVVSRNSNWNDGIERIIKDNLLIGNMEGAVDSALKCGRSAEALIFASFGGDELFKATKEKFLVTHKDRYVKVVLSLLLSKKFDQLVDLKAHPDWKEILIFALNHDNDGGINVANELAQHLLEYKNKEGALICSLIARSFENAVSIWASYLREIAKTVNTRIYYLHLQNIVEKAFILKEALGDANPSTIFCELITKYAFNLVNNGQTDIGLKFLKIVKANTSELLYRITNSTSIESHKLNVSKSPFKIFNIPTKNNLSQGNKDVGNMKSSKSPFYENTNFNTQNQNQGSNIPPPIINQEKMQYSAEPRENKLNHPGPVIFNPGAHMKKEPPPFVVPEKESKNSSSIYNSQINHGFEKPPLTFTKEEKVPVTNVQKKNVVPPPPISGNTKIYPPAQIKSNIIGISNFGLDVNKKKENKNEVEDNIDYSKMPISMKPYFDYLVGEQNAINQYENNAKKKEDLNKKMDQLYKKLAKEELSEEILSPLKNLISRMQMNDNPGALKLHEDITRIGWNSNQDWLRGLKRMIQFKMGDKKG